MSEHEHHHEHEVTPAALLHHMVEHNRSHLEELEHIAGDLDGAAQTKMREAIATIRSGNEQLAAVLQELKEK